MRYILQVILAQDMPIEAILDFLQFLVDENISIDDIKDYSTADKLHIRFITQ